MAYQTGGTYALTYRGVQEKAPNASGLYTIYTSQQWVYVGESDDIRHSLFRHLNEPDACMDRCGPLSFSFELTSSAERVSRRKALMAELRPVCNPARD
jgi:hypothetical protein